MKKIGLISGLAMAVAMIATPASADAHKEAAEAFIKTKVMPWLESAEVVSAINAQNQENAGLAQGDIDKLDKQWRAEVDASSKPLIDKVMKNALSKFLAAKKNEFDGAVTEMFVMDDKGLNVGQSDVTSDFWQGDEAKWKKTYKMGPTALFVDDVEQDESTQQLQSQVSVSIKDPATGKVIGAITVGVNVDQL